MKKSIITSTETTPLRARLGLDSKDLNLAERMAAYLRERGFHIDHVAPRGVGFTGTSSLFEEVFRCQVSPTDEGYVCNVPPQLPPVIANAGGRVYIPSRPTFFS
jgi:hypothetical protein